jgi:hypothetical protein
VKAWVTLDAADCAEVVAFHWALGTDGYAYRRGKNDEGHHRRVAMHRQLLGLSFGDERCSDHINGDRLDNRRENLRVVTRAENAQNVGSRHGRSGHRNVYWHKASGLWRVAVSRSGKQISGGYFKEVESAVEAARRLRQSFMPFAVETRQ